MELKDTVKLMLSEKYAERLQAEYYQLEYRYLALAKALREYEQGERVELGCSVRMLKEQLDIMGKYLTVLELRCEVEGIQLW